MNISQQAIMKHLKVLEDNNLVLSFEEKSTLGGPPRKCYVASKRISLRIDVGPNTFNTEIFDYREIEAETQKEKDVNGKTKEKSSEIKSFEEKYSKIHTIKDPSERLTELSKIVQELNKELVDLKLKRSKLLSLREQVVNQSNEIISDLCEEYNERKILYYLITHQNRNVSTISEEMEMREKVIRDIFQNLIKQRRLMDLDEDFILI